MQEDEGSEFYASSGLNATFFCGYVSALYLLYNFRANGPAFKPGELRRLLVSSDTLTFRWYHALLDDGVLGSLELVSMLTSVIWFFAFTQKKVYALFILGLWLKQFIFSSSLIGLDLSPFVLPVDNKLPIAVPRRSSFIPRLAVADGAISLVLVRVYLTSALHIILYFYFDTQFTGDLFSVLGEAGSAQRSLAHLLELAGVLTAVDRLARILALTEFLRFHVVPALYRLALFTVFSVLSFVLVLDALGLDLPALGPVWTFAFPVALSLARAVHHRQTKLTLALLALASALVRLLPRCFNYIFLRSLLFTLGTTVVLHTILRFTYLVRYYWYNFIEYDILYNVISIG